ncbi:MAG: DUF1501 domain-containing protein [Planctomycetaceae bacterium]
MEEFRGGQVYGKSDFQAGQVLDSPVEVDDLNATIYHAFGLRPESTIQDKLNRPSTFPREHL